MSAVDTIMLVPEIIDNGSLSYLNLASNDLGKLVPPEGWSEIHGDAARFGYTHGDGRKQAEAPEGSKPEGAIAIANAIKDMRAMTSLNLASNNLGGWNGSNSLAKYDNLGKQNLTRLPHLQLAPADDLYL
jgi:hypothetical protein